jgi:hypothetical protein
MIPSRHDYYSRRAHEHRALARRAHGAMQRAMHETLVEAYIGLANDARRREQMRFTI